jgi:hypothetical protein
VLQSPYPLRLRVMRYANRRISELLGVNVGDRAQTGVNPGDPPAGETTVTAWFEALVGCTVRTRNSG